MIELRIRLHAKKGVVEPKDFKAFLAKVDEIIREKGSLVDNCWDGIVEGEIFYYSVGVYYEHEVNLSYFLDKLNTLVKKHKKIKGEICIYNAKKGAVDAIHIKGGKFSHEQDVVEFWEYTQDELPETLLFDLNTSLDAGVDKMTQFYLQRLKEYLLELVEKNQPLPHIPHPLILSYPLWIEITDLANAHKYSVDFDNIKNTV